jgi:hypothetical protein
MCIYDTTLSIYGKCGALVSASVGELVYPLYKPNMADLDSTLFIVQRDMEKICRSGYVNATTGRCGLGLLSTKKVMLISIIISKI